MVRAKANQPSADLAARLQARVRQAIAAGKTTGSALAKAIGRDTSVISVFKVHGPMGKGHQAIEEPYRSRLDHELRRLGFPAAHPERRVLQWVESEEVGPTPLLRIDLRPRVNVLTGDNGTGKSFVLDVVWWVLTGTWAAQPAWPKPGAKAAIRYQLSGEAAPHEARFQAKQRRWPAPDASSRSLILYSRVDGGFSVFDPARDGGEQERGRPTPLDFSISDLWDGLGEPNRPVCNGLIRDLARWYLEARLIDPGDHLKAAAAGGAPLPWDRWAADLRRRAEIADGLRHEFVPFVEILALLSPHPEEEVLRPGVPVQVSIEDAREIPTIDMPYGWVPVTHAAAGIKRVLSLAYLLVWTYASHRFAAEQRGQRPTDSLVLLIDELETHLHPRWQRTILPALLKAVECLDPSLNVQILTTTHAPLILASLEPLFDRDQDGLYLFELGAKERGEPPAVHLRQVDFAPQGNVSNWLTWDIFDLKEARSTEAERAILAAEAFMRRDESTLSQPAFEGLRTQGEIHERLVELLPDHDAFWARWIGPGRRRS